MAFESNMVAKILGLYEDELLLSQYEPGNSGKYIMRNSIINAHHSNGSPPQHPTLSNVIGCFNGHIFLNGNIKVEWEWEPGQITETEIDNYISEIRPTIPTYTFTKDIANNKLYADVTTDWHSNDWINNHIKWQIASPKAKVTLNSDDAELLCVTRLNGSYSKYTFMNRTIEPGETIELLRPETESCFLMFSDPVVSDNKTLKSKRMYKLTSQTLSISNNNAKRVKILRYTK